MAEATTQNFAIPYPLSAGKVKLGYKDLEELAKRIDEVLFAKTTTAHEVGDIKPSLQPVALPGWLLCDGREVSRTTYAALFAVIGTNYTGPGLLVDFTKFHLPRGKERVLIGESGTRLRGWGGAGTVTLSAAQSGVRSHLHEVGQGVSGITLLTDGSTGGSPGYWTTEGEPPVKETNLSIAQDAVESHDNTPPVQSINWYIKY